MKLITSAIYSIYLAQPHTQGYNNWHLGYFGSALVSIGIIPLLISLILLFIGINYLKKGVKE